MREDGEGGEGTGGVEAAPARSGEFNSNQHLSLRARRQGKRPEKRQPQNVLSVPSSYCDKLSVSSYRDCCFARRGGLFNQDSGEGGFFVVLYGGRRTMRQSLSKEVPHKRPEREGAVEGRRRRTDQVEHAILADEMVRSDGIGEPVQRVDREGHHCTYRPQPRSALLPRLLFGDKAGRKAKQREERTRIPMPLLLPHDLPPLSLFDHLTLDRLVVRYTCRTGKFGRGSGRGRRR